MEQDQFTVLKVTLTDNLGRVRGNPYRIFSIYSEKTLFDLAWIITDLFDFDFDHSFGFYSDLKKWSRSDEGYELFADEGQDSRFPGVKKTKIKDVFTQRKKKMLFVYDYGDYWRFLIDTDGEMEVTGRKIDTDEYFILRNEGKSPKQY